MISRAAFSGFGSTGADAAAARDPCAGRARAGKLREDHEPARMMDRKPSPWGRVYAWLQDEVPATTLEAYRRASLAVFQAMDLAEARRRECAAAGQDPWTVPPATRAELLCAGNAYVLQTLGNELLEADYEASPATVGYVPPATARQVLAFYEQVEEWLDRARRAHASPDYRLDVEAPADLPAWSVAHRTTREHLAGVLRAMRAVGEHTAAAMAFLPDQAPMEGAREAQLNRIRQLYASAESKARYAMDLHGAGPTRDVHERLEPYARDAIELFYTVGQLVADPWLAADPAPPAIPVPIPVPVAPPVPAPDPAPDAEPESDPRPTVQGAPYAVSAPAVPSTATPSAPSAAAPTKPVRAPVAEPGFDPWTLTDSEAVDELREDHRAVRAVRRMWRLDPDPRLTLAIHAKIRSALNRGEVAYASDGSERLGRFNRCPWGPVYVATRRVTIAGRELRPMQRFVYDVGVAGEGEPFRRRILTGSFYRARDEEFGLKQEPS
jgi:hypothetical protein